MNISPSDILLGLLIILVAGLLIGLRFDVEWAGGDGRERVDAVLVTTEGSVDVDRVGTRVPAEPPQSLKRGTVILSGENGQALIRIGDHGTIGMHHNTDIALTRLFADELTVTLPRGRVIVNHRQNTPLTIRTDYLTIQPQTTTTVSVVNFDFLEDVRVVPMNGSVEITHRNGTVWETSTPVTIHETEPVQKEDATFDPETDVASAFYRWFNEVDGN